MRNGRRAEDRKLQRNVQLLFIAHPNFLGIFIRESIIFSFAHSNASHFECFFFKEALIWKITESGFFFAQQTTKHQIANFVPKFCAHFVIFGVQFVVLVFKNPCTSKTTSKNTIIKKVECMWEFDHFFNQISYHFLSKLRAYIQNVKNFTQFFCFRKLNDQKWAAFIIVSCANAN